MNSDLFFIQIPLAAWIDSAVNWLGANFQPLFDVLGKTVRLLLVKIEAVLLVVPPPLMILLFTLLALWLAGWRLAAGTAVGLYFIGSLQLWPEAMSTIALVIVSALISVLIGVPLGIWAARSNRILRVVRPILDVMQTMPAFVYLIPAISFFSIGPVPAALATVVYATPPAVRLTNLGIRQVPEDIIEAARAFGSTNRETLLKVQLPLAWPSILQGINQTILMAIAMVVIASMIGAGGLGNRVLTAITRVEVGEGFEGGIAIVIVAMIIDRLTRSIGGSEAGETTADTV